MPDGPWILGINLANFATVNADAFERGQPHAAFHGPYMCAEVPSVKEFGGTTPQRWYTLDISIGFSNSVCRLATEASVFT